MCGIIGIHRQEGIVSGELYEGLLMLQHRGQDSAGGAAHPLPFFQHSTLFVSCQKPETTELDT